jgi:endoglucanase
MYSANHWGGSFEINGEGGHEDDDNHSRNMDVDRGAVSRQLDETRASWLLGPQETKKKNKYIDLGCVVCKRKLFWWVFWSIIVAFIVIGLPIVII